MKRSIPESWLSAYIDGELAADRAALVARFAKKNPDVARQLDELRRVKEALASLPRIKLAGENRRLLWDGVFDHPELRNARETALSAQMDGELSVLQSAALEASFTEDDLREAAKLAEVRDALRTLPKFIAPKDAVARALEQIKIEAFEGVHAAAHLQELPQVPAPAGLLEDSICEMKPLASSYRILALRREGWTTGLTVAVLAGAALFAFTWSPPGIGDGLVVSQREPLPSPQPKITPSVKPGRLVAQSEKGTPQSRSFVRVPSLEEHGPIDPDRFLEKKAPPPALPASLLSVVRPGVKFEDPDTKFTFVCLDITKMAGRLEIVLVKHKVGDKNIRTTNEEDGTIVSVQVNATPEQMARVLTDLKDAEEASSERLIAEVLVAKPNAALAQNEKRIKENPPAANIRPSVVQESPAPPRGNDEPATKIAADVGAKEAPNGLEPLGPDQPRQYVLVFRRQEILPRNEPRKG